jgi:SURF1 family
MQRPHARLLWPSVFTFLAGAALISLGVWQLHRLEWNEKLIAANPEWQPPTDSVYQYLFKKPYSVASSSISRQFHCPA